MKLVIVESPSKAKTIEKYLGKEYSVDASGGHICDLPEKFLGVDVKNNFEPKYVVTDAKADVLKRLKSKAKRASAVYLATDPDREGEAISWHLASLLNLPVEECNRIEFNEISKRAVTAALEKPRKIDLNLVDAQQARRVLDRLVGYKLSPLICKKIKDKLSAGRVQSVALRLIVEREREIREFVPVEYWVISAFLMSDSDPKLVFKATLATKNGKKIKPGNKGEVDAILAAIEGRDFVVDDIKESVTKTHAPAPYTTSTLQQDASIRLGLSSPITMRVAQQLYEGVNIPGEGPLALVTYIRTDSVRVSKEAQDSAREFIKENFGSEFAPKTPNFYKTKKSAQDAHEAIRPISLAVTPKSIKGKVDNNQYKLYKLIYERFIASQMAEARYANTVVSISAGEYGFQARGKVLLFKGFTAVYEMEEEKESKDTSTKLPKLETGKTLGLKEIKTEQKFTTPPPRYSDATLVKTMEELGIGRPSTYASIIAVLIKREYTTKDGKQLIPTDVAFDVNDLLVKYFDEFINVEFTANMENKLDDIEEGGIDWHQIVADFYTPFSKELALAQNDGDEISDRICEKCGAPMLIRSGRFGKYYACSSYPDCKNTKPFEVEESDVICEKCGAKMIYKNGKFGKYLACPNYPDCSNIKGLDEQVSEELCEKCGSKMILRNGKFGKYLACSNYPECKNTKTVNEAVSKCPECGKDVVKRTSRTGKLFYSCSGYPECKFISWDMPSDKKCPKCGTFMVVKMFKNGPKLKCSNRDCGHTEDYQNEKKN